MEKPITALVAAGALGLAMVSTTQPARAMDPWTAAAWFIGGMFVAGAVVAPAYGYSHRGYGYAAPIGYAPAYSAWAAPQQCYWTKIRRAGMLRDARVCY
jgi:hypothetical protein